MLSEHVKQQIDREVAKYPADQKKSAVMAALRLVQEEKSWLDTPDMDDVAAYLDMPPVAVYEVASFYNMYDLKPVGKYKITLCTNLPCALGGAVETAEYLKKRLGINFGETTHDGRFTLKEGECFGACGDAPCFIVNNRKMHSLMTPDEVDKFLAQLD